MTAPGAPPVVINGGDRTCIALLLELRDHAAPAAARNRDPSDRARPGCAG